MADSAGFASMDWGRRFNYNLLGWITSVARWLQWALFFFPYRLSRVNILRSEGCAQEAICHRCPGLFGESVADIEMDYGKKRGKGGEGARFYVRDPNIH